MILDSRAGTTIWPRRIQLVHHASLLGLARLDHILLEMLFVFGVHDWQIEMAESEQIEGKNRFK